MKIKRHSLFCIVLIALLWMSGCGLSENKEENHSVGTEIVTDLDSEKNDTESIEESEETITQSTENTETEETEIEETKTEEESELNEDGDTPTSSKPENTPSNSETPSNSQNPSSSEIPSDSEVEEEIYVVDYTQETESLSAETYKYGVTKTGEITRYYEVYSDGSKVCYDEYTSYSYDTSTYNATDGELEAETLSSASSYMGYYQEVLTLVNQIRAEAGAGPLTLDTSLCNAATMRAVEMDYANYFKHARADERSWTTVFDYFGCSSGSRGENIAAGYGSPASVVEGWKNSSGHYANMINPDYTKMGVGYSNGAPYGYSSYWVQLFSN